MKNLKSCIDACLVCVVTCEECITDCIKDGNQDCISLCRDCADICTLCARFDARGSAYGQELHALCAEICKAC
ncbi:MAG: four-helix bundle copper-binding protein, partial [Bacteroidetes bacterium RIFCSPLOWO2_12_FULL_31_6]